MRAEDRVRFAAQAVASHALRTVLVLAATTIGVAAVVVLTGLGEGARRYIVDQFASLGTNLIIVLPGRTETTGGPPPVLGETPRELTVDDALAIARSRHVRRVAPVAVGAAPVGWRDREREVTILGTTADMLPVRRLSLAQGRFLPRIDPHREAPVCVLGAKLRRELFGPEPALGQWVTIGHYRFRVIGVLAESGTSLGVDFADLALVPVASAQALFDRAGLFRVIAEARAWTTLEAAKADIRRIVRERHEGEDDVTLITQDSIMASFDRVLRAVTLGVGAIAAISLAVAGVLIMNVMLVSVTQRTAEIGLLKALGAPARELRRLFLVEALLLAGAGASVGVVVGLVGVFLIRRLYPLLPTAPPLWAVLAAWATAAVAGLLFGVLPAARAARLDPVRALARR